MTSMEFIDWIAYLDEEPNFFHRGDYYLAMIAAEIRRANCTKPEKVKIKDFILDFGRGKEQDETTLDIEARSKLDKEFFMRVFGIKDKK
jgi:hypothetical protein